jgi:hypothetical protein
MTEEQRKIIIDQIPEGFNCHDDRYFEEEGICRIRGDIGKYGIIIEWLYKEEPNEVWLVSQGIEITDNKEGPCPIENLKEILLKLEEGI